MTGRTVGDYRHVLQTINTKVRNITGHRWRPRRVVCDFEQALIAAVELGSELFAKDFGKSGHNNH
jgi:hypothetical protein